MSVTLYWRPIPQRQEVLECGLPSQVTVSLCNTFGGYPWKFDGSHRAQLRAMAMVYDQTTNPYQTLVDLIDTHGQIEVEAVY